MALLELFDKQRESIPGCNATLLYSFPVFFLVKGPTNVLFVPMLTRVSQNPE